jgi:hypothetical protein
LDPEGQHGFAGAVGVGCGAAEPVDGLCGGRHERLSNINTTMWSVDISPWVMHYLPMLTSMFEWRHVAFSRRQSFGVRAASFRDNAIKSYWRYTPMTRR